MSPTRMKKEYRIMNENEREAVVKYRIEKAFETVEDVKVMTQIELWNASMNRLYYACYYAVIALLVHNKINAQTHDGARRMFGEHFIKLSSSILKQENSIPGSLTNGKKEIMKTSLNIREMML